MRISIWYNKLLRYEWLFFCFIAILNLIPAVRQPFFPSVDGPTHLYNANLILQLVSGHSDFLSGYYAFTDWIVPNWGGHFVLASLLSVCSPSTASRIFIGLCLFLLPLSFRFLVRKINPDARFASYLIFPLCYSFMLCMGFYNFIFGLIILFATLGVLIRYRSSPFRWSSFILLFFMVLCCYLSHLFIFLCLGMIVFCLYSLDLLQAAISKKSIKECIRLVVPILFAFVIPCLLTLIYYSKTGSRDEKIYLLKNDLLQDILMGRSMIWYFVSEENLYTTLITLISLFLFSIAVYRYGRSMQKDLSGSKGRLSAFMMRLSFRDVFLVMFVLMVFLYFKLPDSDSSAGFVSVRLNLMIFLFLILWISAFHFPGWITLSSFAVLFFAQYKLLKLHATSFKELNTLIAEILTIEEDLKENSVILPLNYSDNWLEHHCSNYLGIRKRVVIPENHETNTPYFPLKWNCDERIRDLANNLSFDEILRKTPPEIMDRLDYVFVLNKHAFPDSMKTLVLKTFQLKKETQNCLLFEAGKH
jgi:hypothetical protein